MPALHDPIRYLKGVGPEMARRLERLGIVTVRDLLYHLPSGYRDRRVVTPIARVQPGVEATVEAVQDRVSRETGAQPRGPASDPGERFLAFVLNAVPPDAQEEVEEVFRLGMKLADTKNPMVVFLMMVAEVHGDWAGLAARA